MYVNDIFIDTYLFINCLIVLLDLVKWTSISPVHSFFYIIPSLFELKENSNSN